MERFFSGYQFLLLSMPAGEREKCLRMTINNPPGRGEYGMRWKFSSMKKYLTYVRAFFYTFDLLIKLIVFLVIIVE